MSWRVFIIGRWQASVLESDRDLTLTDNKLKFADIKDKPTIPDLTLDKGTTSPRYATATLGNVTYTLKMYVDDPGAATTPIFLGELVKKEGTTEWYDTILAVPSSEVVKNSCSYHQGAITLQAPAGLVIDTSTQGSISLGNPAALGFKTHDATTPSATLTADPNFPYSNFFNDAGFTCRIDGCDVQARLGLRYVNMLTSNRHTLFGHIQWITDLHDNPRADEERYLAGERTEPFLAIQPPPPLPYGEEGS